MPVLTGIIVVLFQFGILFIAYLSLVHEGRDVARYAAVWPDKIDGTSCSTAQSFWKQVCDDAPGVINTNSITQVSLSPACSALVNSHCTGRTPGSQLTVTLTYDASASVFLPTTLRLGPWFTVALPSSTFAYDYTVMIEPH